MTDKKVKAAWLSIVSNSILIMLKLLVGIVMQSVSVISEAVHSGIDLLAAIVTCFSVRESGKPTDPKHRYGHGKFENVSGTVEAMLIFAAGIYITSEALKKLYIGHMEIDLPEGEEKIIHEVLAGYSNKFTEYHKLWTRKAGAKRHIDMHSVVPKTQTVELSHSLANEITATIKKRFASSHVLVHIEPCDGTCDDCTVFTCQDKR